VPYIRYGRGVFDSLIESFHDTFGFGQMGRDLVARNQFQFIYRVGDVRIAQLERETNDGFGDPVIGVRYSLPQPRFGWDVVQSPEHARHRRADRLRVHAAGAVMSLSRDCRV
jgi:hypothetical protein